MKELLLAVALALAGQAIAGEDSTDRWGAGGTGAAWYQTKCGLASFPGPVPYPDARRPCSVSGSPAATGSALPLARRASRATQKGANQ